MIKSLAVLATVIIASIISKIIKRIPDDYFVNHHKKDKKRKISSSSSIYDADKSASSASYFDGL